MQNFKGNMETIAIVQTKVRETVNHLGLLGEVNTTVSRFD